MSQFATASSFKGSGGGGGGSGDVVGPASATDNAIARYNATTGKLLQNSSVTITDAGEILAQSGSETNAAYSFAGDPSTGFYSGGTGEITVIAEGTEVIFIEDGAIFVSGTVTATDGMTVGSGGTTYTLPSARGTVNQILETDASGNVTWETPSGDQTITLTGGVTGSGTGSFAATVITNANLTGDVTSVGNATTYAGTVPVNKGGTGGVTADDGFDNLSPMTTGGDLIFGGTSGTGTRLANGTSGQVLTSAGGTSAPTWETPAAPSLDVETKAANFTAVSGKTYLVSTAAARAITMPSSPSNGDSFTVKDKTGQAGTFNITMTRAGSESIEGVAANKVLSANWGKWTFVSDGTNWFIV